MLIIYEQLYYIFIFVHTFFGLLLSYKLTTYTHFLEYISRITIQINILNLFYYLNIIIHLFYYNNDCNYIGFSILYPLNLYLTVAYGVYRFMIDLTHNVKLIYDYDSVILHLYNSIYMIMEYYIRRQYVVNYIIHNMWLIGILGLAWGPLYICHNKWNYNLDLRILQNRYYIYEMILFYNIVISIL